MATYSALLSLPTEIISRIAIAFPPYDWANLRLTCGYLAETIFYDGFREMCFTLAEEDSIFHLVQISEDPVLRTKVRIWWLLDSLLDSLCNHEDAVIEYWTQRGRQVSKRFMRRLKGTWRRVRDAQRRMEEFRLRDYLAQAMQNFADAGITLDVRIVKSGFSYDSMCGAFGETTGRLNQRVEARGEDKYIMSFHVCPPPKATTNLMCCG
jgi:CRP-like cAMP-binding protein